MWHDIARGRARARERPVKHALALVSVDAVVRIDGAMDDLKDRPTDRPTDGAIDVDETRPRDARREARGVEREARGVFQTLDRTPGSGR